MLNKDIPEEYLKRIKMIVFDSDGVTVKRGTKIEEIVTDEKIEMSFQTDFISETLARKINKLQDHYKIVISSGRSLLYLQTMYEKVLGDSTTIQAENGSLSLVGTKIIQNFPFEITHTSLLSRIKQDIRKLPIKGIEPKQFILSVHADSEIKEVYDVVNTHDSDDTLKVMWNGEAFDIQPKELSKAFGIKSLMELFNLSKNEVLAIGDRVNDIEMLKAVGIGISADKNSVDSEYYTTGNSLAGESLADYLIDRI